MNKRLKDWIKECPVIVTVTMICVALAILTAADGDSIWQSD